MTEKLVNSNSAIRDIDTLLKSKMTERFYYNNFNYCDDDFLSDYCMSECENNNHVVESSGSNVESEFGRVPFQGGEPKHRFNITPPITNRGVSKYQSGICPNGEIATDTTESPTSSKVIPQLQRGGYDGGIEVGFEGWYIDGVALILQKLEKAKQKAMENSACCFLDICGRSVLVESSGANAGLHYKYVFTLDGVKFLIHHNPPKERQAVRIRYGATSLIGHNFFDVHKKVLEFLRDFGLVITRECLSRVDLQVLVDEPVSLFKSLIKSNCVVSRVHKYNEYGINDDNPTEVETIIYGSQSGRIELCIYDKARELLHCSKSDLVKFELLSRYCFGKNWLVEQTPITRVEFRLWREVLREIDINTVSDLQRRENDLVKWLTYHWFRILARPKVRGHENTAAIHSVWQKVIDLFCYWFQGERDESGQLISSRPILFDRQQSISCNPDSLERQAMGCLSKAFAYRHGVQSTLPMFRDVLLSFMNKKAGLMYDRMNYNARQIEISKGVKLGEDVPDTHLEIPEAGYNNEYDCFVRPNVREQMSQFS
jgi:hypothetical protein